jgi:hypothetical protein
MSEPAKRIRVDAKLFQEPMSQLVQTMVEKVFREGSAVAGWQFHVSEDLSMLLRYSLSSYHLLFYLNADTRRQNDSGWQVEYGVTAMSLVRSMIDCFYKIFFGSYPKPLPYFFPLIDPLERAIKAKAEPPYNRAGVCGRHRSQEGGRADERVAAARCVT